jgi:hypothetical protein
MVISAARRAVLSQAIWRSLAVPNILKSQRAKGSRIADATRWRDGAFIYEIGNLRTARIDPEADRRRNTMNIGAAELNGTNRDEV